jgi:HEAT repeat protein
VDALRDVSDVDSAIAAAAQLQESASSEDIPPLVHLLSDRSFFVREAEAWPLSDLGRVDVLPELLAAYQRGLDEGHDNDGFSAARIDLVQSKRVQAEAQLQVLARRSPPGAAANLS